MNDDIIQLEKEQHYEHKRGSIYTIEYLNEDIVVLYDGQNYRLENREYFVTEIDSGMYDHRPDSNIVYSDREIPFEDINGIGETTLESLQRANIRTVEHFTYATGGKLLDLDGMGQKTIENVREWIEEHENIE